MARTYRKLRISKNSGVFDRTRKRGPIGDRNIKGFCRKTSNRDGRYADGIAKLDWADCYHNLPFNKAHRLAEKQALDMALCEVNQKENQSEA